MTRDRWWTLCKNCRFLALMVWDLWCFEDLEEKDRWLNESVNDGGVCRTAPATPGLLIMQSTCAHQVLQLLYDTLEGLSSRQGLGGLCREDRRRLGV